MLTAREFFGVFSASQGPVKPLCKVGVFDLWAELESSVEGASTNRLLK